MKKLDMNSPDLVKKNIDRIAELFPNCLTEAADEKGELVRRIDFDLLRQELDDSLVEGSAERFRLDWPGKRQALLTANAPIAKTLRPDRDSSINFDTTCNIYIEGDNLDALKLLQENYLGKVKMIYIDPPYNTGHDFIYKDDFAEDSDEYFLRSNQKDEKGNRLTANTEANGRFHSDWLSMMYSRLKLARNLLQDDGVIFISIDDNEQHRARMIFDEIFGESNFVATIIWQKVYSPKNTAKHFSEDHDFILIYARYAEIWRPILLPRTEEMTKRYQNPDNDPRGPWKPSDLSARNFYSKGTYPITTPTGRLIESPPTGNYWRVSKERFDELDNDNRIWWGEDGNNIPAIKRFISEVQDGIVPQTLWGYKDVGHTQEAKKEIVPLVSFESSKDVFDTPKPVRLLKRMMQIATVDQSYDLILDFFSGSGTTAHATMELNSEDGGNRRFILVQLPEDTQSEKFKTISEIGRERIRRAGKKILERQCHENWNRDIGFRSFKIDSSNMAEVYYTPEATAQSKLIELVDNIKPGRTVDDLLFQVMLDWGLDLSLPLERKPVAGAEVFEVDGNALAVCFVDRVNEELVTELASHQPPFLRMVFRDSSFQSDSDRINVEQIFKQLSPSTEVKVI